FFQANAGRRFRNVTGVQTCALPICGPGHLADLSQYSASIVGARSCTTYGADISRDIAADLSAHRITVISGAAYGIDAFAHRGAQIGRASCRERMCVEEYESSYNEA